MLFTFRKAYQSWIVRILFGLLALSFVGWGIGPELRMRAFNQPAITAGDDKISAAEVGEDFRREAENLQRMTGGKVTIAQAKQMGLVEQSVRRLVTQSLFDQASARLGLAVDDATVQRSIAAIPAFRNRLNQFDAQQYQQVLQANGFTQTRFEAMERKEIRREEFMRAIEQGVTVPAAMLDPIFARREEQRVVEIVSVPAKAIPAPATPDDKTLEAYYKDHSSQFMAPEMRAVTAVLARASDLASDYKPTDDQIKKAYDDRIGQFTNAETRDIKAAFFADEAGAKALVESVKSGKSFADAAKDAGKEVQDLGQIQRKDVPLPEIAAAAFAAEVPGVAGPVKTALGWNALYISDRKPGTARPLSDVRDQVVKELVKQEQSSRLATLSNKIEDTLGSGAPLEELASSVGLKLVKIAALDELGHGADGKPVADAPDSASFRRAAFQTAKGSASDLLELEGGAGYFVVRVDEVTPAAVKPFDQVKAEAQAAWIAAQQLEAAAKKAADLAEKLSNGEAAAKLAAAADIKTSQPFTRAGDENVPPPIAAAAFTLESGKAVSVATKDGAVAIRLKQVLPADPKSQFEAMSQLKGQLKQSIASDLNAQYLAALANQYGVTVRRDLIAQQLGDESPPQ